MDALYKKREEWDSAPLKKSSDFKITLLGGSWTAKNKGVLYDAWKAEAKAGLASDFCMEFGLPKSATFTISKFGEAACHTLAFNWAHRLQWLLDVYVEGDGQPDFFAERLSTYVEHESLARSRGARSRGDPYCTVASPAAPRRNKRGL